MTSDAPARIRWSAPRIAALVLSLMIGAVALLAVYGAATASSDAAGNALAEAVAVITAAIAVLFALPALGFVLAGWGRTAFGFAVVGAMLTAGLALIMA